MAKIGLIIIGTVVGAVGAVVAAPVVVAGLGFTTGGIAAGSVAASMMSAYGGSVAAGSAVAVLQSVGAAGMGAAATGLVAASGGAVGAAVGVATGYGVRRATSGDEEQQGKEDKGTGMDDDNGVEGEETVTADGTGRRASQSRAAGDGTEEEPRTEEERRGEVTMTEQRGTVNVGVNTTGEGSTELEEETHPKQRNAGTIVLTTDVETDDREAIQGNDDRTDSYCDTKQPSASVEPRPAEQQQQQQQQQQFNDDCTQRTETDQQSVSTESTADNRLERPECYGQENELDDVSHTVAKL